MEVEEEEERWDLAWGVVMMGRSEGEGGGRRLVCGVLRWVGWGG